MVGSAVVMGASLAIELVRFVMTSRELEGKTPEQVLAMWSQTNTEAKAVHEAWDVPDRRA